MKYHWQYLKYVLRHKRHVYIEGRKIGLNPIRLILHDWSKLTPTEWKPYVLKFIAKVNSPNFDKAWLHHIHCNPHHWQHWILNSKPIEMPHIYRLEMLADWNAMSIILGGSTSKWFYSQDDILLHPNTRKWIESKLNEHKTSA